VSEDAEMEITENSIHPEKTLPNDALLELTDQLLKVQGKMVNPGGFRTIFPLSPEVAGGYEAKLRVTISPSREMMAQYIQSDNNMSSEIRKLYLSLIENPTFVRMISLDILTDDRATVIGTSELHLINNGEELIAIDPQMATRFSYQQEYDILKGVGVPKADMPLDTNNIIKLDYGEQWYTNSFLVNNEQRGKGIGRVLFRTGNTVAKILGARDRVVWSSTEDAKAFYTKQGATIETYNIGSSTKSVPMIHLQARGN